MPRYYCDKTTIKIIAVEKCKIIYTKYFTFITSIKKKINRSQGN